MALRLFILQDGFDRFSRSMREPQGVIDPFMERLRSGGFSDMNDFIVVPFHRCGDAHMAGQSPSDGAPTVMDPLFSQKDANRMQDMVRQDGNEQMAVCAMFLLMINRAQSQL